MKIIRWLLSHIFLILLIVVVIYGYMFWGNLAGEDTPAGKAIAYLSSEFVEVEEFVNAIKAKQKQSPGKQTAKNEESDVEKEVPASEDVHQAATESSRDIEQNPVTISYSHNQTQVKQNSSGDISVAEIVDSKETGSKETGSKETEYKDVVSLRSSVEPVLATREVQLTNRQSQPVINNAKPAARNVIASSAVANGPDTISGEKFVSPDIEKQLDNVDENGKVLDLRQKNASIKSTWLTARKSYYQRDYALSEKSYQKVIDSTDNNYDAYGELGNVYFNQGKKEQAASAYFEAAAIFVRIGQVARARSLVGLLRNLDKSKADELQRLIQSVSS